MKRYLQLFKGCVLSAALLLGPLNLRAADVTVDPGASWLGFMNVFQLPSNGGGFVFNGGWGTADLRASFSGSVLTLAPNTIGDPDPFWYIGGGGPGAPGNKIMDANFYQEFTGPLAGQTVNFSGLVLGTSLTSAHNVVAFIKDFAPDYSSSVNTILPLTAAGAFNVSLATINDPARHVQFGFTMNGVNVWATDVGPFGTMTITAIPEPSLAALAMAGIVGLMIRRRNAS